MNGKMFHKNVSSFIRAHVWTSIFRIISTLLETNVRWCNWIATYYAVVSQQQSKVKRRRREKKSHQFLRKRVDIVWIRCGCGAFDKLSICNCFTHYGTDKQQIDRFLQMPDLWNELEQTSVACLGFSISFTVFFIVYFQFLLSLCVWFFSFSLSQSICDVFARLFVRCATQKKSVPRRNKFAYIWWH